MARIQDPTPRRQRLTAVATVAALAVATALAFGRVFLGRAPTLKLVAAGLASVALAALLERRGLVLATAASAAAMLWAVALLVFPRTLWYGLPSRETLEAVRHALGLVGEQAKVQVAPTQPLAPLLLAAVTALWTAAFSAHALAVRAGSPLLSILPPVALVGFADTVLEDGARPLYAVAFLAAALAVVFIDGLRRVRQWGPVWSGAARTSRPRVDGARSVALVAVSAAVLLPGLLPGFRSEALLDFSSTGHGGAHLDPFVSIKAQLEKDDPIDLFRVTSPEPSYWRVMALDRFDGTTWSSSDPNFERGQTLLSPARVPSEFPPGAPTLQQRVELLTDYHDPLPMAYPPEEVDLSSGGIRYDRDLSTVVVPGGLDASSEYQVRSRVVLPTPEQLEAVAVDGSAATGDSVVPPGVDPRIEEIAVRWTQGKATPYGKVLAIQQHFLDPANGFVYDEDVRPASDADALLDFLTRGKAGFCQQFATAMAVMVRELGYPARVAVGYRPGVGHGDTYTVSTVDAHAWVEVQFPTYGWLRFDPTPRAPYPTETAPAGTYLNPVKPTTGSEANTTNTEGTGGEISGTDCTAAGGGLRQLCNADPTLIHRPDRPARAGATSTGDFPVVDRSGYHVPYRLVLLVALAIALLVSIVVPPAKALRRRRLFRRAKGPRELVLAAYRVFDGEAADLGLGRGAAETLEEYRARLAGTAAMTDGHLAALTSGATRAAYGSDEPSEEEAAAVSGAARGAISDLRRGAGLARRVTGTYRPGW